MSNLNVSLLLRALDEVDVVVVGSVAIRSWGVDVGSVGDLDVVPSLDQDNLRRLGEALAVVGAEPRPTLGRWASDGDQWRWCEYEEADPRRGGVVSPDPSRPESVDNCFDTRFGDLDIVPYVAGTFEELRPRATMRAVGGSCVPVASVADLLIRLTVPRRKKDAARVAGLRKRQLADAAEGRAVAAADRYLGDADPAG